MKTIGVRALRENPGLLGQAAATGEYVLITNRNNPVSLSVPFDDALLQSGVHINLAIKLFDSGLLSLVKAAKLAQMPAESFLNTLSSLGIDVIDQSPAGLDADLKALDG